MSDYSQPFMPLKLRQILPGHYDEVGSLRWSPDGSVLASGSEDGTIRLWNFPGGKLLRAFYPHNNFMCALTWSSDGRFLVSTARCEEAKIWDIKENKLYAILENSQAITADYSPNNKYLTVYGGAEITIINTYSLDVVKVLSSTNNKHSSVHNPLRWSNNGKYLAVDTNENIIYIYRTDDWSLYNTIDVSIKSTNTNSLHYCDLLWMPDDNNLLITSYSGTKI